MLSRKSLKRYLHSKEIQKILNNPFHFIKNIEMSRIKINILNLRNEIQFDSNISANSNSITKNQQSWISNSASRMKVD